MDKSARYDRQERIWGKSGQAALEQARVCLVNATGLGAEILKNLVLPGIGTFHIVDGATVSPVDTGNNFFVTRAEIGQPRATVVANHLARHNPFVKGGSTAQDPQALMTAQPEFFAQFSLIILSQCTPALVQQFGGYCEQHRIDLIVARSAGEFGLIRLYAPEHTIVESKPEVPHLDLRIADPFAELREYAASLAPERVPIGDLGHIPYVCLLIQLADQWKAAHGGAAPRTAQEKKDFKKMVFENQNRIWEATPEKPAYINFPPFENYDQAVKEAHRACAPTAIPGPVAEVLASPAAREPLGAGATNFWFMVQALRLFTEANEGRLPVSGRVPDMIASSANYVGLQRVYMEKAQRDAARFREILIRLLTGAGVEQPESRISPEESEAFARDAAFIRVMRYTPLGREVDPANPKARALGELIGQAGPDPKAYFSDPCAPQHNALLYALFGAADSFYSQHGRWPGASLDAARPAPLSAAQFEADSAELRVHLNRLCRERLGMADPEAAIARGYCEEMVRTGAGELHAVAALLGGVAGQEAFKLVARQFTPLENTFLYNGLFATSCRVEL
eukprot:GAFH01001172.1.p2 GENE.GAFH01001172.1~~GAFH01001172.1.p2  ORF type:complete len:567 (-),score=221.72 GAFH01001172.1:134-1834(-)